MIAAPAHPSVHSANVQMTLALNDGTEFPLSQVGPGFAILAEPSRVRIEAGEAVSLSVAIDGAVETWPLRVAVAIDAGEEEVALRARFD
jgi:hypothetical protein